VGGGAFATAGPGDVGTGEEGFAGGVIGGEVAAVAGHGTKA
jgi:hypothetical protein